MTISAPPPQLLSRDSYTSSFAQAHAQKNGDVRERVCAYFEQDHLQGTDTAVPDAATCCKGALWSDVLAFTRGNYEDIDR